MTIIFIGFFSFESNTSLRRLCIKQQCSGPKDQKRTKRLHWLVSLLSTIPADSKLQTLELVVGMPHNPHGTEDASLKPQSKLGDDLAQLDAIFVGDSFENIERLQYEVRVVDWSWKSLPGHIVSASQSFPLASERGILEFKRVSNSSLSVVGTTKSC